MINGRRCLVRCTDRCTHQPADRDSSVMITPASAPFHAAARVQQREAWLRQARRIPSRHHPLRQVTAAVLPDPRHPIFRDYTLACGHSYGHIPLKRSADGRFHVAHRMRCPLCAVLAETVAN
jgi:hypothetical protein